MRSGTHTKLLLIGFLIVTSVLAAAPGWRDLHQLGSEAYAAENYSLAEQYFSKALTATEEEKLTDVRLLATLNNLASTYTQLGKFEDASAIFARFGALQNEFTSDPNIRRALIESSINHAAFTLRRGKPMEAQAEFERALKFAEQALGPDDNTLAQICNHLALIYKDAAQYAQARQCAERALAIRETQFGPGSLLTAASISALSQVAQAEGKFKEAEALCRRALAIRREHGPDQPRVAESLSNLGTVLKNQGDYAAAERLYLEAQQLWLKAYGAASFEAALVSNNLGSLYLAQGKLRKAENQFRQAMSAMEKAAGPESPSFALVLANFATLYREARKWDQAEMLIGRAVAIDEKALGPLHPHVALDLAAAAQVAVTRKDYLAAEALLRRALSIHEMAAGAESVPAAETAFQIAMVDQLWAKPEQAAPYFARALKIWKAKGGSDLEVARALEVYALALKKNQQFADAARASTAAVGIRVQAARTGIPNAYPSGAVASFH